MKKKNSSWQEPVAERPPLARRRAPGIGGAPDGGICFFFFFRTICRIFTGMGANPVTDVTKGEKEGRRYDLRNKGHHHRQVRALCVPPPLSIIKSWHISSHVKTHCADVSLPRKFQPERYYERGTVSNVLESPDGADSKG